MSYGDEDRREGSRWLGWSAGWVVAAVVLVLLLTAGIWAVRVATSEQVGQGNAVRKKNSSDNWVKQQEDFQRRYNSILSQDKNITIAYKRMIADPTDQVKEINYSGAVSLCNDAVGQYNSKANEYNSEDFRDASLPAQIDQTNPQTDCQEDK